MKSFLIWLLAILITLSAAIYQRLTGPTHPYRGTAQLAQETIKYRLPRSHTSSENCPVEIKITNKEITGTLHYKRFPSRDDWSVLPMTPSVTGLIAELPTQPPAGKLQYFLTLALAEEQTQIGKDDPIIIRYKGAVPLWALLPHVLLMFSAMLLSTLTALKVVIKSDDAHKYAWLTYFFLGFGGMILGPVVQKFAFGEFWTGVPFGWDLTDNKTLIAFLGWTVAMAVNWKRKRPEFFVVAAIILMVIYMIPHSFMGSELNYETMEIKTG